MRLARSSSLFTGLALMLALFGTGLVSGAEPLTIIPQDVVAVLAFPKPAESGRALAEFIQQLKPGFSGIDLDEIQRGFNLPDGIVDFSAPAFVVLTRLPMDDTTAYVLVFKPANPKKITESFPDDTEAIQRHDGPEGVCYLTMHEDWAMASTRSRTLRQFRRAAVDKPLAAALDSKQRELFSKSDVVLHLPMAKIRDRIQPWILLATNMIRLSAQTRQHQAANEGSAAMLEWFSNGFLAVANEMASLTLAMRCNHEAFTLTHHHVFADGQSVSDYLGQVRRRGLNQWQKLPDRPFLLIGAFDWASPGETSLTTRFNKQVFFTNRSTSSNLGEEHRRRISEAMSACYDSIWGTHFMVTSPDGSLLPIGIYGGYAMADARKGFEHLRYLQENAGEVMSSLTGEQFFGKFEQKNAASETYWEMALEAHGKKRDPQQRFFDLYGNGARVQEGILDDHHVAYVTAAPPFSIGDLMALRNSDRNIATNTHVREMLKLLPAEPNAVIILDLGRCLGMLPQLVRLGRGPGSASPATYDGPDSVLLGWACTVQKTSLTGCWAIQSKEAPVILQLLRQTAETLTEKTESLIKDKARNTKN